MTKVILDTNVLVSSLLASGPPAAIVDLVADGKIVSFYNDLILKEYYDILSREKFGFSTLQVTRLINDIVRTGMVLDDKPASKIVLTDEDDRVFYDAAVEAGAYLITGNIRHFPPAAFVVMPAQFLGIYRSL